MELAPADISEDDVHRWLAGVTTEITMKQEYFQEYIQRYKNDVARDIAKGVQMAIDEMQGPTPEDELCEKVTAIVNRVPWEEFTTTSVNDEGAARHIGAQIHEIPANLLELLTGEYFAYNPDG